MIIEFCVKNFRSIREMQKLSFVATELRSDEKQFPEVDIDNICSKDGNRLLKTLAIYGANASGKSNILKALVYFLRAISDLPSPESGLERLRQPFYFQDNFDETESFFQIIVLIEGKKYRYGFTVIKNDQQYDNIATNQGIESEAMSRDIIGSEWLFEITDGATKPVFTRTGMDVFPSEQNIPALPYPHSLYLSHSSSYESEHICSFVRKNIHGYWASNILFGQEYFRFHTIRFINDKARKDVLLKLFHEFDLHYDDIEIEDDEELSKLKIFPRNKIYLLKYGNKKTVRLNLQGNESDGVRKLFDLAGLILLAFSQTTGGLIILDEIDSNFHPSLLIKLVGLFNDREFNTSNTQLVFVTHDTNLLDPAIMRRDQFYFAEKDLSDATRLYSLSDLKGIPNDAEFARQYLSGIYGAVPKIETLASSRT